MADVIDLARVKEDLQKIKRYEVIHLHGDAAEADENAPTGRAAAWVVISLGLLLIALIVVVLWGCVK